MKIKENDNIIWNLSISCTGNKKIYFPSRRAQTISCQLLLALMNFTRRHLHVLKFTDDEIQGDSMNSAYDGTGF